MIISNISAINTNTSCINNETRDNFFFSKHNSNEPGLKKMLLGSPMICDDQLVAVLAGNFKAHDTNTSEVYFVWTKVKGKSYDWLIQVMDAYTRSDVMPNQTDEVQYNFAIVGKSYFYENLIVLCFYLFDIFN